MTKIGNHHYITVDDQSRIVNGWSDGPHPEIEATGAILITDEGGYQFRLWPDGEDNPMLLTWDGIPIYKWEDGQVVVRTEEEIAADRAAIPPDPPTQLDRIEAQVVYTAMKTDSLMEG